MRVLIAGGTGTIGRRLIERLRARGDDPIVLTRDSDKARRDPRFRGLRVVGGDPGRPGPWQDEVDGADAVVNLAGRNVFEGRWTADVRRQIRDSRVYSADQIVAAIGRARSRPAVFVQGSAIGYYGSDRSDEVRVESSPSGADFLAVVCRELEDAAQAAGPLGVRVVTVRTGVVLAPGEGALGVMAPLFRWVPGGAAPVAGGRQWISWIHIDDIVGLLLMAIDRPEASGPINGVAPTPERNLDFSKALARAVDRPFLPVGPPEFALKLLMGQKAEVVTRGQRVEPAAALGLGFRFGHPDLAGALASIFGRA